MKSLIMLLSLLALGTSAFAQTHRTAVEVGMVSFSAPNSLSGKQHLRVPVNGWVFVGCVASNEHCHHHAHEHGFLRYTISHDHQTCPRPPGLACYGSR